MNTKIRRFLLGSFALLSMTTAPLFNASACTCPEPSEALSTDYYNDMDYVFEGEVISTSKDTLHHTPKVTIKIKREYKGDLTRHEVAFDYNPAQNLCGFRFEEKEIVTLGAYRVKGKSPRIAFSCAQMGVRKYLIMQGGYPR